MEKAGYLKRTRITAIDGDGSSCEVLELYVYRERFAMRVPDLARSIPARRTIQVESLTHHWNYYLGATAGLARVSRTGKALNIEIFGRGRFTLSLGSIRELLYGREYVAPVMKIPDQEAGDVIRSRRTAVDRQQVFAEV